MALREHRIDTGRLTVNVREAGQGRPAVFMHGITANAAIWDPVLDQLASAFRVVSMDQRGHGLTDKPPTGYTAEELSDDVLSLVETLDAGPALLVGHSLGARNALVAATRRPELVAAVVAIDFTPYIEPEVFDALSTRVRGGDRLFGSPAEITAYLSERYPRLPLDAIERRARHGYRAVDGGYRPLADPDAMAQTADGLRADLAPAVRQVRCPTLLIRGADSTLVSPAAFERTLRLRPDFAHIVVAGADHYVPEEQPDAVCAAIRTFAKDGPQ
ncbi:MAG TPA: alpha/beta hydrolase [Natronosporangium sp.]